MTKTAQTDAILAAILQEHGAPAQWTMNEARAAYDTCPRKYLFDDFDDLMCALIVRARSAF